MAKYVGLLEIFGYLLAGVMLTLWIIFFFIRIDENCFGSGAVKPATIEVSTPDRAVLDKEDAETGKWVKKGQTIYHLNLDEKAVAARQAQKDLSSLGKQILTLAKNSPKEAALEHSVQSLVGEVGGLATGRLEKIITAPEDGLFQSLVTTSVTLADIVVQGPLANVVSSKVMRIELELGQLNRGRVAVGQKVNITIRLDPKKDKSKITGKVIKVPQAGKALVEARVTDPAVGERLAKQISDPANANQELKAEAKVVVGNVPFVRLLFPKNTTPEAPKAGKEEGFFKRIWHTIFPAPKV
jgi:hypothetical protein